MPLDADLLEMLACPSDDHAPLREETRDGARGAGLHALRLGFPIEDGIPVLLLDEAMPGPERAAAARGRAVTHASTRPCSTTPDAARAARRAAAAVGAGHRRAPRCAGRSRLRGDFGVERLRGDELPRALLVATDARAVGCARGWSPGSAATRTPALAWHGVELPRWAGPADALLDRLGRRPAPAAGRAGRAGRRGAGWRWPSSRRPGRQVAAAAGRAPLHELPRDLHPRAARWAVLTPLLQALDALGLQPDPARRCSSQVADALDETGRGSAARRRRVHQPGQGAGRGVRRSRARSIVGAGPLAGVAARAICRRAAAVRRRRRRWPSACPTASARAGALLRGAGPARSTTSSATASRTDRARGRGCSSSATTARPRTPLLGERVRTLRSSSTRWPPGGRRAALHRAGRRARVCARRASTSRTAPPLARFAAAAAFGEFTAAYLAFGLGLDPGRSAPGRAGALMRR